MTYEELYKELEINESLQNKAGTYHVKKILEDIQNLSMFDIFETIKDPELKHLILRIQCRIEEKQTDLEAQKQHLLNKDNINE